MVLEKIITIQHKYMGIFFITISLTLTAYMVWFTELAKQNILFFAISNFCLFVGSVSYTAHASMEIEKRLLKEQKEKENMFAKAKKIVEDF